MHITSQKHDRISRSLHRVRYKNNPCVAQVRWPEFEVVKSQVQQVGSADRELRRPIEAPFNVNTTAWRRMSGRLTCLTLSKTRRPCISSFRSVFGIFSNKLFRASSLHPASMDGSISQVLLLSRPSTACPNDCSPSYCNGRSTRPHSTKPFTLCKGTFPRHCETVRLCVHRAQGLRKKKIEKLQSGMDAGTQACRTFAHRTWSWIVDRAHRRGSPESKDTRTRSSVAESGEARQATTKQSYTPSPSKAGHNQAFIHTKSRRLRFEPREPL